MTPYEINSFRTKVEHVLEVFNSKVTEGAWMVWADLFRDKDYGHSIKAMNEVVKTSRFSPKPADVLALMQGYKIHDRAYDQKEDQPPPASPRITAAWIFYHRLVHGGDTIFPASSDVVLTKDEALEIVNEQAAKYNLPDAIMPEYTIDYYWPKQG